MNKIIELIKLLFNDLYISDYQKTMLYLLTKDLTVKFCINRNAIELDYDFHEYHKDIKAWRDEIKKLVAGVNHINEKYSYSIRVVVRATQLTCIFGKPEDVDVFIDYLVNKIISVFFNLLIDFRISEMYINLSTCGRLWGIGNYYNRNPPKIYGDYVIPDGCLSAFDLFSIITNSNFIDGLEHFSGFKTNAKRWYSKLKLVKPSDIKNLMVGGLYNEIHK